MTLIQRVELLAEEVKNLESGGGGGDLSAYLTKEEASSTYETQTGAAATYETQSHASSTYVAKNANPLVIATYTNPDSNTNDGTANIYLGSLNNSLTANNNNVSIGYGNYIEAGNSYNNIAIGNGSEIEQISLSAGKPHNNVAIQGYIKGSNSVAINGQAKYGNNSVAIKGSTEASNNVAISGKMMKAGLDDISHCVAINTNEDTTRNTSIQGGSYSTYIGEIRKTLWKSNYCVGIGHDVFNKDDQTYNNVVAIGKDLLPSTSNCVILGSFSNDMSSSGSFFAVGNGTSDANRSNLVEITTPFKVSTTGIEANGAFYTSTASSTETLPIAGTGTTFDTGIEWSYIQTMNDFILDSSGEKIKFRYGFTKGSKLHYFGYILDDVSTTRIVHLELGAPTGSGTTALATWLTSGAIPTT